MAADSSSSSGLPVVLLLAAGGNHPITPALAEEYHFLKPWESSLSRDEFLRRHASSIRCVLLYGLAPLDGAAIQALPNLECVLTTSAGIDHIDLDECRRRRIAVANAGAVFSEDAAEYAVGLLIDVLRRISAADRYVRRGLWAVHGDYPLGTKLGGKRVGIVGLGSIGSKIATRLQAFGCIISYTSRREKYVSFPYFSSVHDLAAWSDILIVTCALNVETHHMINRSVLLALGAKGVIINVGRGALVNEKELVKYLNEGGIAGAGLDVFEEEPYVPRELYDMDNVVLSPHKTVLTEEAISDLYQLIKSNLEAFFSDKPLVSRVEI